MFNLGLFYESNVFTIHKFVALRTLQLYGKEHFSYKDTYCYPTDRGVWLEGTLLTVKVS